MSFYVGVTLVLGIVAIRRGHVPRHRSIMTAIFVGGLVVAGLFTLPHGRLMYQVWLG